MFYKTFQIFHKICKIDYFNVRFSNRTNHQLLGKVFKLKADLYIAHNLGALPVAVKAAKKYKTKSYIDFEDYYSGIWNENSIQFKNSKWIENKYIPFVSHSTAASPLIRDQYKKEYDNIDPLIILNVFSKKFLVEKPLQYSDNNELKLFWFSQTVGKGRGLEEVIKTMGKLKANVSCTFLGSCNVEIKTDLFNLAIEVGLKKNQIIFLDPVSPFEIFEIAAQHHIGLALEFEDTINRNICLTNKIFTYLLSGLAIIATDTLAQKQFLNTYKGIGNYYSKQNIQEFVELISNYQNNPDLLNQHRLKALQLANEKLNWEEEQKQFLSLIKKELF